MQFVCQNIGNVSDDLPLWILETHAEEEADDNPANSMAGLQDPLEVGPPPAGMQRLLHRDYDSEDEDDEEDEHFPHQDEPFPDQNGADDQEEQIVDSTAADDQEEPIVDSAAAQAEQRCRHTQLTNETWFKSMDPPPEMLDHLFHLPGDSSGKEPYDDTDTKGNVQYGHKLAEKMSAKKKSDIDLLNILKGHSIGLFSKIMEWSYRSQVVYDNKFSSGESPTTRENAMKAILQDYGYDSLEAQKLEVTLPGTGKTTTLIRFPFKQMLQSLLTDPGALDPDNLLINWDNPYAEPVPIEELEKHEYGDVDTGEVRRIAFKIYCKSGRHDVMCEIILFIDKTYVDTLGKLTVEPIIFTLSVFNRGYRSRPRAWRPIGYIPNMDALAPNATPDEKLEDYHFCIRVLLSELAAHQTLGGIDWTFVYPKEYWPKLQTKHLQCRLQIPVSFVIGDTEGHDKLCARLSFRGGGKKKKKEEESNSFVGARLCRYCDCTFDHLDKPEEVFKKMVYTKCKEIRELRNQVLRKEWGWTNAQQKLKDMNYKPIHDGFVDILFADPEMALHGACPAELLHAFQLGLCERVLQSLFGMKKSRKTKRKRSEPAP